MAEMRNQANQNNNGGFQNQNFNGNNVADNYYQGNRQYKGQYNPQRRNDGNAQYGNRQYKGQYNPQRRNDGNAQYGNRQYDNNGQGQYNPQDFQPDPNSQRQKEINDAIVNLRTESAKKGLNREFFKEVGQLRVELLQQQKAYENGGNAPSVTDEMLRQKIQEMEAKRSMPEYQSVAKPRVDSSDTINRLIENNEEMIKKVDKLVGVVSVLVEKLNRTQNTQGQVSNNRVQNVNEGEEYLKQMVNEESHVQTNRDGWTRNR